MATRWTGAQSAPAQPAYRVAVRHSVDHRRQHASFLNRICTRVNRSKSGDTSARPADPHRLTRTDGRIGWIVCRR